MEVVFIHSCKLGDVDISDSQDYLVINVGRMRRKLEMLSNAEEQIGLPADDINVIEMYVTRSVYYQCFYT